MMNFRGVTAQTLNFGNLCFVASFGLLISAQWEMVRGNTFSYTVLSAYGMKIFTLYTWAHPAADDGKPAKAYSMEATESCYYPVWILLNHMEESHRQSTIMPLDSTS